MKKKIPAVAKYTTYSFDANAKFIGQEDYFQRIDRADAAITVSVRFPVRDNATVAVLLRDIATQIVKQKAKR